MSEDHNQSAGNAADAAFDDAPFDDSDVASMEDILASIRSMIAEDAPDTSEVNVPVETTVFEPAPLATPEPVPAIAPIETPFDIESLLEPTPAAVEPDAPAADDPLKDIEHLFEPPAPSSPEPAAIEPQRLEPLATPSMDIGETEDMDLVKSLMADLTEAPDSSEPDVALAPIIADAPLDLTQDWSEGDVALPEIDVPQETPVEVVAQVEESETLSILDDILDQSLADEEALNAAVELPEFETTVADTAIATTTVVAGGSALAALAAQADADAAELTEATELVEETPQLAEIATPEPELKTPTPKPIQESPSADLYQALEEEVMARNAPLEEIVADEVETEAGSAFAELNRLVEEKQEFQDRGPRIGDLVQEALKPMLKEWLDENLKASSNAPSQKEVKRIASGKQVARPLHGR